MSVERYRKLIPDWDRFTRVTGTPEPTTLRIRSGRGGERNVAERLRERGFELRKLGGVAGFYRIEREPYPLSATLEHWLGDFYIQQAVTGLAAPALGARPGERVLDLCAAPGGKTTHLADLMGDTGTVVASDPDARRLRALLANVYRLAHPNVLVVEADGRCFPGGARFDRVLVDAPCSAEGTLRRHEGILRPRDPSFTEHISGVQRDLLGRAMELVRPGGVVLYVTCTFAPEENEAVVDDVLRRYPGEIEPVPLDIPHAPGLTAFEGRRFREDLSLACRIYPHHLDSGGLFLTRIRRPADSGRAEGGVGGGADEARPGRGWSAVPHLFPAAPGSPGPEETCGSRPRPGAGLETGEETGEEGGEEAARARERIERGVKGVTEAFGLTASGPGAARWMVRGGSVWTHRCASWPVDAWDRADSWRVISLGIRALKTDPRTSWGERPTSDLLRMMEGRIRRGTLDLDREDVAEVLHRRPLEVEKMDRGFAALRYRGRVLGRGWVKGGVLSNEISKARSAALTADPLLAADGEAAGETMSGARPATDR